MVKSEINHLTGKSGTLRVVVTIPTAGIGHVGSDPTPSVGITVGIVFSLGPIVYVLITVVPVTESHDIGVTFIS